MFALVHCPAKRVRGKESQPITCPQKRFAEENRQRSQDLHASCATSVSRGKATLRSDYPEENHVIQNSRRSPRYSDESQHSLPPIIRCAVREGQVAPATFETF